MSRTDAWTQEMVNAHLAKFKTNHRSAVQATHLESAPSDGPMAKKESKGLDSQFRVRCLTRGKRLGDVDGRSCKAVFDAFTKAGIWPDDNPKFVKEVSFTQEPGEEDETIIVVDAMVDDHLARTNTRKLLNDYQTFRTIARKESKL